MARDLPTKKGAIKQLLDLDAGALRMQACGYFVKMQESGWNDQMQQPDAPTKCSLGVMYRYDYLGVPNLEKALRFFNLSAREGYLPAQVNLAVMHLDGEGVAKDPQEALRLFQCAANQGHVEAQYNSGVMHWEAENFPEAFKYLSLAAGQGYAAAIEALQTLAPHVS